MKKNLIYIAFVISQIFFVNTALGQSSDSESTPTSDTRSESSVSTGTPSDDQLETVKIESNKGPRDYQKSTESISLIPSNQLDVPAQRDNLEAVNATPNISINKNDGSFSIRGINNTGVTGYAKDNVSSILLDDIYQTDLAVKAGAFDMWDINHIEVYRGPQSTTQGINSLAGSLSLFKNKAGENEEGGAKFGLGSFNKQELGAFYNGTSLDKKWLYRVTMNREYTDGYIKNETNGNDKWGKKEKYYLGFDLVYKVNENDHLRFNVKYITSQNGGNYVNGPKPFDYKVYEDLNFDSETKNIQTSLRYFKTINAQWTNETIAAFTKTGNTETSDADGLPQNIGGLRSERHKDQYYNVENLLKYNGHKVRNTLGLHAHNFKLHDFDNFTAVIVPPTSPGGPVTMNTIQESDKIRTAMSVFNNYEWDFAENQTLILGGRYEYIKNDFDITLNASIDPTGTPYDAIISQMAGHKTGDMNKGIFVPKIGYLITQDQNTYGFSISQGYRTGGVSVNRLTGAVNEYNPEVTTNYELSFKHDGTRYKIASNLFYTDWRKQQVLVQLRNQYNYDMYNTQVMNAGSSELYGAELEGQFILDPRNTLSAGVGYVHTEFKEFESGTQDYKGKEFPFSPKWTGRLYHSYNATDNFTVYSIYRYISSSFHKAENTTKSPEQHYLDMSAQYLIPDTNIMIDGYVKNVLNKKYVLFENRYLTDFMQVSSPTEFGARLTMLF